jgi:mitochondrial fission protein ELM1
MVSEACASGRRVIVIEPPRPAGQAGTTKHRRFLEELAHAGHIQLVVSSAVSHAIRESLAVRDAGKRLDDFDTVREAVRRFIS